MRISASDGPAVRVERARLGDTAFVVLFFFAADLRAGFAAALACFVGCAVASVWEPFVAFAGEADPLDTWDLVFLLTCFKKFEGGPFAALRLLASGIFAKRLRSSRLCDYGARVRHFIFRWMITTIAVMVASALPGIRYDNLGNLIGAALLLGILNAFVRPVLLILSAPLILVTLGFFILVVNALLLRFVPSFVPGFHVDSFGAAFWGAILIGIVSWMLSAFFRGSDGRVHILTHHTQIKRVQGRVIDPAEGNLK